MPAKNVKKAQVYKLVFELAMEIFGVTKSFLKGEKYTSTVQVRNSSRSVCTCLIEAHRKMKYELCFVEEVMDSDVENSETCGSLDFSGIDLPLQYEGTAFMNDPRFFHFE